VKSLSSPNIYSSIDVNRETIFEIIVSLGKKSKSIIIGEFAGTNSAIFISNEGTHLIAFAYNL
jgi:hypothetical protein